MLKKNCINYKKLTFSSWLLIISLPPSMKVAFLWMNKFEFFKTGSVQSSYGGQYSYKVIGPCCRLYDREELPWPCSRLAWRSKEPSWRRIGSRFVADMASRKCPSYSVQILEPGSKPVETVITLFSKKFSSEIQELWYSKKPGSKEPGNIFPSEIS